MRGERCIQTLADAVMFAFQARHLRDDVVPLISMTWTRCSLPMTNHRPSDEKQNLASPWRAAKPK